MHLDNARACIYNIINMKYGAKAPEEAIMGLGDFIKRQFRKVIQWETDDKNAIVWKFPLERREEIMRKSTLVVREGQKAIFIKEGKLCDVFGPGTYELDDIKNIPILTALYNWKTAWESPYTGDLYFVSTKQFIDNKWGTSNPVMMKDKDFGMVRVRGFGVYSFAIGVPTYAMNELFGSTGGLTVSDVDNYFKKIIVSVLTNSIAESGVSALELAAHYDDISAIALAKMQDDFGKMGIEIKGLYIENLSVPEEVEKMIDKRTSVGVMGDAMAGYAQMETVGAMRDAAKNPGMSGGMANAGIGLGAGLGIGKMFAEGMAGATSGAAGATCPHCGAKIKAGSKFCPDCGKAISAAGAKCPSCGKSVPSGTKFCPECGASLAAKTCPKCGKEVPAGTKFCPDCGAKIK